MTSPHLPPFRNFTGKRASPAVTAIADAVLALSLAAVCFPENRWTCPAAVLLALIPLWISAFSARRTCGSYAFAPDPLAPNYAEFLSAFASSAAEVASGERENAVWTLCPLCAKDGKFQPYTLDFIPARGAVVMNTSEGACKTATAVIFRPRLALPVTVTDTPVRIRISAAELPKQACLSSATPAHFPWNRPFGNEMRAEIIKGVLSAALLTYALFPESAVFSVERLVILAALLILFLFKSR